MRLQRSRAKASAPAVAFAVVLAAVSGVVAQQVPLAGSALPQFVDPLPSLDIVVAGTNEIVLHMREFQANVMPTGFLPANGLPYTGTYVWGYLQDGQTSRPTHLGPVIVATRGTPTQFRFVNELGSTGTSNVLAYTASVDQTLHWADPLNGEANMGAHHATMNPGMPPMPPWDLPYSGPIPACVHLHGGEVPAELDGGPDAWFTSDGAFVGHGFYSLGWTGSPQNYSVYRYPNLQEAAPIWFHDHTLGATRLNVYAGLAGGYLLTDPASDPQNLPGPLVPLVIQDRMFDTNGQLYFPAGVPFIPNPDHPLWVPEFVGDTILVNGKVWPYLNVEPKRYRFLFLNGSNARTYEMFLVDPVSKVNGPPLYQIGTDGGYLDAPVKIDPNLGQRLVIMPGERADAIIDFAGLAPGTTLILRNVAKTPYPAGAAPQGSTTGRIIQFRVLPLTVPDTSYDPATATPLRRQPLVRLVDPVAGTLAAGVTAQKTRVLTLNEVMGMPMTVNGVAYPGGPLEVLVNNTKWSGESPRTYGDFTPITARGKTTLYSEIVNEGQTEVWEIVNLTADAHPMHLHLVQFQLINRQRIDVPKYTAAYGAAFPGGLYIPGWGPPLDYRAANNPLSGGKDGGNPDVDALSAKGKSLYLQGLPTPPRPNEAGWKDTIQVFPGQVTRLAVRWAPTDLPAATPAASAFFPFDPSGNGQHGYVWHCHIIDHEDNEMMRPDSVTANPAAVRSYVGGTDY